MGNHVVSYQHVGTFDASPAGTVHHGTSFAVLDHVHRPRQANLARQILGNVLYDLVQRAVKQDVWLAVYPSVTCAAMPCYTMVPCCTSWYSEQQGL